MIFIFACKIVRVKTELYWFLDFLSKIFWELFGGGLLSLGPLVELSVLKGFQLRIVESILTG